MIFEFEKDYEDCLDKSAEEEEEKNTISFHIEKDEIYKQNEDNQENYEKIKFEIGTQTNSKYEDNNNENIFIRYKEINNKKLINDKNNNEEKKELKEEIGLQTINYNKEDENEDEIENNNVNSHSFNKKSEMEKKYKINKKNILGRKTKRSGLIGKHNKFSLDNIIRKVKAKFIDSAFHYINKQFKNKKLILLKIIGTQGKEINKNKNIIWLQKTMKDIFYEDITKKTYNSNKNYNREIIDKIYLEKDEQKVISLLNLSIIQFMNLYCSQQKIDGMKQLDDVINELKLKGENEEYLNKFKMVSLEFVSIIKNLKSRERKINN